MICRYDFLIGKTVKIKSVIGAAIQVIRIETGSLLFNSKDNGSIDTQLFLSQAKKDFKDHVECINKREIPGP